MIREWPGILAAEGSLNPAARRTAAVELLAAAAGGASARGMVIAAGSTGSIPATARLLGVIAQSGAGRGGAAGAGPALDAKSWTELEPGHPQFGLKQLLDRMGGGARRCRGLAPLPRRCRRARRLLRETLRPAPTTDAWRALAEQARTRSPRVWKG